MKFKSVFLLSIAFVLSAFSIPKNLQKKMDKEIIKTFKVETISYNEVVIPAKISEILPAKFGNNNLFKVTTSDDEFLCYAYISKAASKTDDFDYLVLLDKDLVVLKAKVLIYREDYGGEIGSKRWLKQFIGKSQNDELRYGDNIIAISGATISVRSMTNAMNDVLKSLKILHSKDIL
ncbi:FMN-binding protein [Flavobacteriales bacterium 34_180_T64]|nr:FMN-binding protein [Flavobacteriales bacterium 34_180_T64]